MFFGKKRQSEVLELIQHAKDTLKTVAASHVASLKLACWLITTLTVLAQ